MSSSKYLLHSDSNHTCMHIESTLETPKAFKYLEYWKKARKAIRLSMMIYRFNNLAEKNPCIVTENILMDHLKPFQEEPIFEMKSFILVPHGSLYMTWSFIIIICLIFLTSYGIFNSAFIGDMESPEIIGVESIIDLIFIFDILISINLAAYDSKNNLIFDRRLIMLNYFKSRLIIDLASGIPSSLILIAYPSYEKKTVIVLRHFLKMIKWIGQLNRLKNFTLLRKIDIFIISHRKLSEFVFLLITIATIIHIFTCLFFLIARYEDFSNETWVVRCNVHDLSLSAQYLTTMYFIITTLATIGYGDLRPFTEIEMGVTLLWTFIGLFLVSVSVSQFTILFDKILKGDSMVTQNIILIEDFSLSMHLSQGSIRQIKRFIRDKKIIKHNLSIFKLLEPLNPELKYEIAVNIYNKAITKITFFQNKSYEFLSEFTFFMEFCQYQENEYIWRKGSFTDGIYFIISGKVKFIHENILFYLYYNGGFFGDLETFFKSERKFDVMVCEICKCFKINLNSLKILKSAFPKYYKDLKSMFETRKENLFNSLGQMIAIHQYRLGNLLNISKTCIEEFKYQIMQDLFSSNFFANQANIIESSLHDLKLIKYHETRIKSLLCSLNIPLKPDQRFLDF